MKRAKPSDPNAALTFFWEVEGSDGARFFLLGSVHLGDARGLVLDPQIERDWNASQELVVQLDATALSDPLAFRAGEAGRHPGNRGQDPCLHLAVRHQPAQPRFDENSMRRLQGVGEQGRQRQDGNRR